MRNPFPILHCARCDMSYFLARPEVIKVLRKIARKGNPRIEREIHSGADETFQEGFLKILALVSQHLTRCEFLSWSYADRMTFCRRVMFYAKERARRSDPHTVHVNDSDDFTDIRIGSGSKFHKEDDFTSEEKQRYLEVTEEIRAMGAELDEGVPEADDTPAEEGNDDAPIPPSRHPDLKRAQLNELYLIHKLDGTLETPKQELEYEQAVTALGPETAASHWDLKSRTLMSQRHPDRPAMTSTERSRLCRWKKMIHAKKIACNDSPL